MELVEEAERALHLFHVAERLKAADANDFSAWFLDLDSNVTVALEERIMGCRVKVYPDTARELKAAVTEALVFQGIGEEDGWPVPYWYRQHLSMHADLFLEGKERVDVALLYLNHRGFEVIDGAMLVNLPECVNEEHRLTADGIAREVFERREMEEER